MTAPIKYCGGKTAQLKTITPFIFDSFKTHKLYIEPFVGGGSVIIDLLKQCEAQSAEPSAKKNNIDKLKFHCYDLNEIVIRMFNEIKNNPTNLIERLDEINKRTDYYNIRDEYNQNQTVEKFIYLNKRCFRGLYRVNLKGEFNASKG